MKTIKQVCNLLEAADGLIPLLSHGSSFSDPERVLIDSVITRLRSAFLVWDSIKREQRFLRMPPSQALPKPLRV
jgi:hypothetical protein